MAAGRHDLRLAKALALGLNVDKIAYKIVTGKVTGRQVTHWSCMKLFWEPLIEGCGGSGNGLLLICGVWACGPHGVTFAMPVNAVYFYTVCSSGLLHPLLLKEKAVTRYRTVTWSLHLLKENAVARVVWRVRAGILAGVKCGDARHGAATWRVHLHAISEVVAVTVSVTPRVATMAYSVAYLSYT